jgi:hypothetical protein
MGAIKNAIKSITKGIEKAAHGLGQFAKGMATLNLKAAAQGLKEVAHAGAEIARGVINLTPAAMAANTLLNGALDKILKKAEKVVDKVADTMVDNVEGGLSNIKKGVENTVKGIATGDFKKVVSGMKDLALGAVDVASNFGPGGIAKNVARMAVDAAIDVASQEAAKAAAKVLDPNGNSKLGGMATDLIEAGVNGGLNASRAGRFASGETDSLRRKSGDVTPDATGPVGFKHGAREAVENAALDMAETAVHQAIGELMGKLQKLLDPQGDSRAADHGVNALQDLLEQTASSAVDRRRQRLADGPQAHHAPNAAHGAHETHAAHPSLRAEVRDAVHMAVMQAVEAAVQAAVLHAVDKAMQSLPQDQKGAFAALALLTAEDAMLNATHRATTGRLNGGGAGPTGQAGGHHSTVRDVAQGLKQDMRDAVETAVKMAVEMAVEAVVKEVTAQVMKQIGQPGSQQCIGQQGNPLHDALRDGLQHKLDDAVKQVVAATVKAVGEVAAHALAAGLGQELGHLLKPGAGGGFSGGIPHQGDVNVHLHIRA